jgi:pyruvate decarboxylase
MSAPISYKQVFLDDPVSAPKQIDDLLADAWVHARPVYLMVPTDMVPQKVSGNPPLGDVDDR